MIVTARFLDYLAYKADMAARYPGAAVLSYRDWLDFGYKV